METETEQIPKPSPSEAGVPVPRDKGATPIRQPVAPEARVATN
jgi:hypothetical protein